MSNMPTMTTGEKQLMLVHKETVNVSRPASTQFNIVTLPLPYTDTGYTPMVMGYYTGYNGDTMLTSETFSSSLLTGFGLKYMAGIGVDGTNIRITAYGASGDATAYTIPVTYYVFINSVLDE